MKVQCLSCKKKQECKGSIVNGNRFAGKCDVCHKKVSQFVKTGGNLTDLIFKNYDAKAERERQWKRNEEYRKQMTGKGALDFIFNPKKAKEDERARQQAENRRTHG